MNGYCWYLFSIIFPSSCCDKDCRNNQIKTYASTDLFFLIKLMAIFRRFNKMKKKSITRYRSRCFIEKTLRSESNKWILHHNRILRIQIELIVSGICQIIIFLRQFVFAKIPFSGL